MSLEYARELLFQKISQNRAKLEGVENVLKDVARWRKEIAEAEFEIGEIKKKGGKR